MKQNFAETLSYIDRVLPFKTAHSHRTERNTNVVTMYFYCTAMYKTNTHTHTHTQGNIQKKIEGIAL